MFGGWVIVALFMPWWFVLVYLAFVAALAGLIGLFVCFPFWWLLCRCAVIVCVSVTLHIL